MALKEDLSAIKPGQSAIIITSDDQHYAVASEVLNYLTKEQNGNGIYVSINVPYSKVTKEIGDVEWNKILFLDGISKTLKEIEPEDGNCIQLQGPNCFNRSRNLFNKSNAERKSRFSYL